MDAIPFSKTVTLHSVGLDEAWLQAQIWESPSCLGLGELEGVAKERAVSSGGRLDILLKNPVDDSMYEVETMLGATDPDHIVRTIEYWDLMKRKWPQRQHYAVLVAERITKRFFNVIQILSGAVPLIAIQVNVVESPHGKSLHFTKIIDVYEEHDDNASSGDGEIYDEAYWVKKSQKTLASAGYLLSLTQTVYSNPKLGFNKYSVVITSSGYNQLLLENRSGNNVLVHFHYGGKREEILELLSDKGFQYTERRQRVHFQIASDMLEDKAEMFVQIAELNKDWWMQ